MARVPGAEAIYAIADQFRERCLVQGRSLLWPNAAAWTDENLKVLWSAFVDHPDEGKDSFVVKWRRQLESQSVDVHRIAADVTALYYLFPGAVGTHVKVNGLREVLSWLPAEEQDPPQLNDVLAAFERGIGHQGIYYLTGRPWQVAFYLKFARTIIGQHIDPYDVETARRIADASEVKSSRSGRNVLLHLLFPDSFERISSDDHKQRIVTAFADRIDGVMETDDALLKIRRSFEVELDRPNLDFYDPDIRLRWEHEIKTKGSGHDDNGTNGEDFKPTPLTALATATHYPEADLREIETLLIEKRQIVFEGPPGSGKTYLADLFGRWFAGLPLGDLPDDRIELIQFNQSYGYEDFVQGIRPETDAEGRLRYVVRDGIFLRLCELAANDPDRRHVLIIDEINRGNISRIFGELLLLLEYRSKRARLPYAAPDADDDGYLTIPENLYLIGTMNSTDRSLAQVDYALRRRFYFRRLMPVVDGRADVLAGWLASREMAPGDRTRVLNLFLALNRRVEEQLSPDYQVGHSYLMVDGIQTRPVMDRVWRHAVFPLLEEYFYAHRDRAAILGGFALDRLLAASADVAEVVALSDDPETDGA